MLMLTSQERIITGVDGDENKIDIARYGYLRNDRISFLCADVSEYPITPKDGFLLGEGLHSLPYYKQESLLKTCITNLKPGGMILLRFNKTRKVKGNLFSAPGQNLTKIAEEHGLTFERTGPTKTTSDNYFVMRRQMKDNGINILT